MPEEFWRRIPSFPDYEMTRTFKVRRRESKRELQLVDGVNFSLRAEGKSYMRSATRLYETTFRAPAPSFDPNYRVIPEFPKYEISKYGLVRNRETQQELREQFRKEGGNSHNLRKDGSTKNFTKSTQKLLEAVWPEFYIIWRKIPGYSEYEIARNGTVRRIGLKASGKRSLNNLRVWTGNRFKGVPHVKMLNDEGVWEFKQVIPMLDEIWPDRDKGMGEIVVIADYIRKDSIVNMGWRDVPGFSLYQMHITGSLRNKKMKKLISKQGTRSFWYNIQDDSGRRRSMSQNTLWLATYPEMAGNVQEEESEAS